MIPKIYGFEHKIEPKIIGHYLNLQMISSKENLKKGTKTPSDTEVNKQLSYINNKLIEFDYFK